VHGCMWGVILPRQQLPWLLHLPLPSPVLRSFLLSIVFSVLLAFGSRRSRTEVHSPPHTNPLFPIHPHSRATCVLSTNMNTSTCLLVARSTKLVTHHSATQLRRVSTKSTVSTRQPAAARAESARKAPLANHKRAPQPTSKIGANVLKSPKETATTHSKPPLALGPFQPNPVKTVTKNEPYYAISLHDSETMILPDGRTLGYAVYGSRVKNAKVVVAFHGTPGSRLRSPRGGLVGLED
jgi:hypothetical protein